MTVVEKAAYLKGLAEGLGVEPETREGKLWAALTDLLSSLAHEVEDLKAADQDFADALDEMSEDLSYLEELTCDLDLPSDMEEAPCAGCPGGCAAPEEEEQEPEYDGVIYDATCPNCGQEVSFDEETLEKGSILCPHCGEVMEFDLSGSEEE